ncbi:MAG TPA: cytochrome c [Bryobacteraceae bacterium]|nr:cytochrome c [Bryobacteraceae bacterium]
MNAQRACALCLIASFSTALLSAQIGDRGASATTGSAQIQRWWWAWPGPPDPQSVERGKAVFARQCASCHAGNAAGTSKGANLMRSTLVRHDADGSALRSLIETGKSHGKVPSIRMSAGDANDVVAYIEWAVQNYDRTSAGAPPQSYPLSKLLIGNAEGGKAFFNGEGGCAKCHSPTGDLAGIASKYSPIELQSRFLMPRSRTPVTATVTTASGEKVSGRVLVINNFDVSIQDAAGKTLKWAADSVKVELHDPIEAHRDLLPKYTDADVHNMFAYLVTLK